MKKIISMLLTLAILPVTACSAEGKTENIKVELDKKAITFDVEPQIRDGRTLVPMRKIFEEIGAFVKWDDETRTVTAKKSSKTISLAINSDEMTIDKGRTGEDGNAVVETVKLDVPAQIIDDRTLVPVRVISEAFDLTVDWDETKSLVSITSSDKNDNSWKENTGTVNLSDLTCTGSGIEIDNNRILITQGGDFTLRGSLNDGNITIQTEDRVRLRLAGASIVSNGMPCIYAENADKVFILAEDNTENFLTAKSYDNGAVYSKENLEIEGNGVLNITSDGDGIKASDNLTIESGILNISAAEDAVHVNDTFKMNGGSIKAEAVKDGIDSESIVIINGGEIDIKTTLEPSNTDELNISDEAPTSRRMFETPSAEFENSSKGIKAEWIMVISGGDITVNSTDHAIHCASDIEISGGKFVLNSAYAKGVSGHGNVTVDGADTFIDVQKCTEGLESKNVVTVNNGTIRIIASDDAINGGGTQGIDMGAPPEGEKGGNRRMPAEEGGFTPDMPSGENGKPMQGNDFGGGFKGGPPQNNFGANLKNVLIINGGDIELQAKDDCLDANGNIVLNGGTIKTTEPNGSVSGVTAVFDPDGTITIGNDVKFIAAAGSGSAQNFDISQRTITLYTEEVHEAGDKITLTDNSGTVLAEYSPTGSYSVVWFALPEIEEGASYTVTAGNETQSVTVSEQNTVIGTPKNGNGGFGGFSEKRRKEISDQK